MSAKAIRNLAIASGACLALALLAALTGGWETVRLVGGLGIILGTIPAFSWVTRRRRGR